MSDEVTVQQKDAASAAKTSPPKEKKVAKPRKPAVPKTHPQTSEMVDAAINTLKERGGSSIRAIKKYISGQYQVDVEKLAPLIKKYVKSSVLKGTIIQTKGIGATGSFKMPPQRKKVAKKNTDNPKAPAVETKKLKPAKPTKTSGGKKEKKVAAKKPKAEAGTKVKNPAAKSTKKAAAPKAKPVKKAAEPRAKDVSMSKAPPPKSKKSTASKAKKDIPPKIKKPAGSKAKKSITK
jgi:histone H1/5